MEENLQNSTKTVSVNVAFNGSAQELIAQIVQLEKATQKTTVSNDSLQRSIQKALGPGSQSKFIRSAYAADKFTSSIKNASDVTGKLGDVINNLGVSVSLARGASAAIELNKHLVQMNMQFGQMGDSTSQVQGTIQSLSDKTGLARDSVMGLASSLKNLPIGGIQHTSKLLTNIHGIVGADVQAIKQMGSAISEVIKKYPQLQMATQRLSEADKLRLQSLVNIKLATGQMGIQQARTISQYLNGSSMMSSADKARIAQQKKQQQSMQQIKKVFFQLSVQAGQVFLPLLKSISSILQNDMVASTLSSAVKLGSVLGIVLLVTKGITSTLQGSARLIAGMADAGDILLGKSKGGQGAALGGAKNTTRTLVDGGLSTGAGFIKGAITNRKGGWRSMLAGGAKGALEGAKQAALSSPRDGSESKPFFVTIIGGGGGGGIGSVVDAAQTVKDIKDGIKDVKNFTKGNKLKFKSAQDIVSSLGTRAEKGLGFTPNTNNIPTTKWKGTTGKMQQYMMRKTGFNSSLFDGIPQIVPGQNAALGSQMKSVGRFAGSKFGKATLSAGSKAGKFLPGVGLLAQGAFMGSDIGQKIGDTIGIKKQNSGYAKAGGAVAGVGSAAGLALAAGGGAGMLAGSVALAPALLVKAIGDLTGGGVKMGGQALAANGHQRTGALVGLAGSAIKIAGTAAAGAMAGALIGGPFAPVTAAIGGVVGGLVGVYQQWGDLSKNARQLIKSDSAKIQDAMSAMFDPAKRAKRKQDSGADFETQDKAGHQLKLDRAAAGDLSVLNDASVKDVLQSKKQISIDMEHQSRKDRILTGAGSESVADENGNFSASKVSNTVQLTNMLASVQQMSKKISQASKKEGKQITENEATRRAKRVVMGGATLNDKGDVEGGKGIVASEGLYDSLKLNLQKFKQQDKINAFKGSSIGIDSKQDKKFLQKQTKSIMSKEQGISQKQAFQKAKVLLIQTKINRAIELQEVALQAANKSLQAQASLSSNILQKNLAVASLSVLQTGSAKGAMIGIQQYTKSVSEQLSKTVLLRKANEDNLAVVKQGRIQASIAKQRQQNPNITQSQARKIAQAGPVGASQLQAQSGIEDAKAKAAQLQAILANPALIAQKQYSIAVQAAKQLSTIGQGASTSLSKHADQGGKVDLKDVEKAAGVQKLGLARQQQASEQYQKQLQIIKEKLNEEMKYASQTRGKEIQASIAQANAAITKQKTTQRQLGIQLLDVQLRRADAATKMAQAQQKRLGFIMKSAAASTAVANMFSSEGGAKNAKSTYKRQFASQQETAASMGNQQKQIDAIKDKISGRVVDDDAQKAAQKQLVKSGMTIQQSKEKINKLKETGRFTQIASLAVQERQTSLDQRRKGLLDSMVQSRNRQLNALKASADLQQRLSSSVRGNVESLLQAQSIAGNSSGAGQAIQKINAQLDATIASKKKVAAAAADIAKGGFTSDMVNAAVSSGAMDKSQGDKAKALITDSTSTDRTKALAAQNALGEIAKQQAIKQNEAQMQVNKTIIQRKKSFEAISMAYQHQLKSLSLQTQMSSTMVDMMDNMAVGVSASMQMRMKVVDSLKQQQQMQKKIQEDLQSQRSTTVGAQANLALENKIKESKQTQLQLRKRQLDTTKALRDGWVGAVGAMTTGHGRISKIMMDQNQNLMQAVVKKGALTSTFTGSADKSAGATKSQQFNINTPEALQKPGFGKKDNTYDTSVDKALGIHTAANAKKMIEGSRQQQLDAVGSQFKGQSIVASNAGVGGQGGQSLMAKKIKTPAQMKADKKLKDQKIAKRVAQLKSGNRPSGDIDAEKALAQSRKNKKPTNTQTAVHKPKGKPYKGPAWHHPAPGSGSDAPATDGGASGAAEAKTGTTANVTLAVTVNSGGNLSDAIISGVQQMASAINAMVPGSGSKQ